MTVKDYIFTKHHAYRKILKYKLCKAVDPSRKVPDLNCGVRDLLLLIRGSGSQIREREFIFHIATTLE